MHYSNYDDYMNTILGYSNFNANVNYTNRSMSTTPCQDMCSHYDNLERLYPEVYKVIYPIIFSVCSHVNLPITEEMLQSMTDNVYDQVEKDGRINIEVYVNMKSTENDTSVSETTRQPMMPHHRNRFFNDFIRILLLRELLGRRPGFPFRPF